MERYGRKLIPITVALLLTATPLTARADFIYTFERTSSNPYSFSLTFPTLLSGPVQDPFGPIPFNIDGPGGLTLTVLDSILTTPGFVGFSGVANSIHPIGTSGEAIGFGPGSTNDMMVLLSASSIGGPGVYPLPFIIANTTSLPVLERLIITESSAVPEPSTVVLLGCGMLAAVAMLRKLVRT